MEFKTELQRIEKEVETNKLEQARLQERKSKLEEDRQEILKALKDEGLEESELQDKVNGLEIEIEEELANAKELLRKRNKDAQENKQIFDGMVKGEL